LFFCQTWQLILELSLSSSASLKNLSVFQGAFRFVEALELSPEPHCSELYVFWGCWATPSPVWMRGIWKPHLSKTGRNKPFNKSFSLSKKKENIRKVYLICAKALQNKTSFSRVGSFAWGDPWSQTIWCIIGICLEFSSSLISSAEASLIPA